MEDLGLADRIKTLVEKPNVLESRGERIMPQALSLLFDEETRRGLWWYNPKRNVMDFSATAQKHFQADSFSMFDDFRGWVRGGVFEHNGLNYLLIQAGDFPDGILPGQMLENICLLAESKNRMKVSGVVEESGRDLLGA